MSSTWSYDQHKSHELHLVLDEELPSCYTGPETVDAWRHVRLLDCARPLLSGWPGSEWITIGDGNFGSDAHFLRNRGVKVTATSISSDTLSVAHARGWIDSFAAENAESLSFADDGVDFVLCKEALHHFPRPAIGFYEMLRVARTAVVLIEPIEVGWRPLSALKSFAKVLLRGASDSRFEPSGNYVYRLSIREVFKMLTALGYPCFARKGMNDCYVPRLKNASAVRLSAGLALTRAGIQTQNLLSRVGLLGYGLAALICFKQKPGLQTTADLKKSGFVVVDLPRNPYRAETEARATE